jgi:hypothetical protein
MNELFKEWDKAYKKAQEVAAQVKQVNEFWVNAVISSLKQFTK